MGKLDDPENIVVFDADGTLFSYNYGTARVHHDLDTIKTAAQFRDVDIYAAVKGIPVIRDYIWERGLDLVYVLSKETSRKDSKTKALSRYYGILPGHCFYVEEDRYKIDILKAIHKHFEHEKRDLIYIDDSEQTLRMVEDRTDFCTAHVTVFFEEGMY